MFVFLFVLVRVLVFLYIVIASCVCCVCGSLRFLCCVSHTRETDGLALIYVGGGQRGGDHRGYFGFSFGFTCSGSPLFRRCGFAYRADLGAVFRLLVDCHRVALACPRRFFSTLLLRSIWNCECFLLAPCESVVFRFERHRGSMCALQQKYQHQKPPAMPISAHLSPPSPLALLEPQSRFGDKPLKF